MLSSNMSFLRVLWSYNHNSNPGTQIFYVLRLHNLERLCYKDYTTWKGYATKSLSESRITRITRIFADFKSLCVLMCFSLYRVGCSFSEKVWDKDAQWHNLERLCYAAQPGKVMLQRLHNLERLCCETQRKA